MLLRSTGLAVLVLLVAPWDAMAEPVGVGQDAPPGGSPAPVVDPVQTKLDELEAKVAALEANAEVVAADADAASQDPTFDIHGFIDMGLSKLWTNNEAEVETTKSTFVLGNINLYFGFHPAVHWSALAEVRFTNQPDGAETVGTPGTPYARESTAVIDSANGIGDDVTHWGAIILERAYIQWQGSQHLGVRVGQFLTPFGIWNADHGTPTLISIVRPESIDHQLFPRHQVGIEVFGEHDDLLPGRWALGYHAYVSNGRTPGQVDLTEDKMLGGRLVATTTRPRRMAFGVSAMSGTYRDETRTVDAADKLTVIETVAYREIGYAVDASIDLGALRLRGELTVRDLDYRQGKRQRLAAGIYAPDTRETNAYLLAAYRLAGTRYEPYLYTEAYRIRDPAGDLQLRASAGLNIYFTPAIQLKVQCLQTRYFDTTDLALNAAQETQTFLGAKLVMGL